MILDYNSKVSKSDRNGIFGDIVSEDAIWLAPPGIGRGRGNVCQSIY